MPENSESAKMSIRNCVPFSRCSKEKNVWSAQIQKYISHRQSEQTIQEGASPDCQGNACIASVSNSKVVSHSHIGANSSGLCSSWAPSGKSTRHQCYAKLLGRLRSRCICYSCCADGFPVIYKKKKNKHKVQKDLDRLMSFEKAQIHW